MKARRKQAGVAIVTALLLTALAITIVTSLFWQQQVQIRSMQNQRLQSQTEWVLRGALDWSRLILNQQGRDANNTNLTQPWAAPLEPTRLDSFVEDGSADGSDAVLSGKVEDAQARFNLNNVVQNNGIDPKMRDALGRLLQSVGVSKGLADSIAVRIKNSQTRVTAGTGGGDNAQPIPMSHVDDLLSVRGITPAILAKFRDYVIFLPGNGVNNNPTQSSATPINPNTASAQVFSAMIPALTLADAQALVARRDRNYFRNDQDFVDQLGLVAPSPKTWLDQRNAGLFRVTTDYFLIYGQVHLDRAEMQMVSLVNRNSGVGNSGTRLIWTREY